MTWDHRIAKVAPLAALAIAVFATIVTLRSLLSMILAGSGARYREATKFAGLQSRR